MSEPKEIALVDDHRLLRKGLAGLLTERGYSVSLQADNGKQFIEKLQGGNTADLVLLDINMPVMDGYATAQWIRANYPDMKMLALSVNDDENAIIRMLHCGVRGYVIKDCEPEELTHAIQMVMEHGYYHSELVSSKLIHSIQQAGEEGSSTSFRIHLSEKEKEFLRLNCSEMTYKEIAARMHLSPRTIDGYRDSLFEKLEIKSRVGLVLFAIRHRLIQI